MELEEFLNKESILEQNLDRLKKTQDNQQRADLQQKIYQQFNELVLSCVKLNKDNYDLSKTYLENLQLLQMVVEKYDVDSQYDIGIDFTLTILQCKSYVQQYRFQNGKKSNRYKGLQKFQNSLTDTQEALENFCNFEDQNFYATDSIIMPYRKQYFGHKTIQYLNYCLIYLENLLQQTACLSQMQKNHQALQKAYKCHEISKNFFQSVQKILDMIVMIGPDNLNKFKFSSFKNFINITKYVDFILKIELPILDDDLLWEPESQNWKYNQHKFLEQNISSSSNYPFLIDKFKKDWIQKFTLQDILYIKHPKKFI